MNTKLKTTFWQLAVSLIPLIYLAIIWENLSEQVPMHYNSSGVDRYGSKWELFCVTVFVSVISFGSALLLRYLNRIDPKRKNHEPSSTMLKLSWVLLIFISTLSLFIIYSSLNYSLSGTVTFSGKYLMLFICLMFVVLANFLNSIKPSYFVGFRTPWALANEENWRKTHFLGSRVMFFTGIIMGVLILLVPEKISHYIFVAGAILTVVVPFVYSYNLFRKERGES